MKTSNKIISVKILICSRDRVKERVRERLEKEWRKEYVLYIIS